MLHEIIVFGRGNTVSVRAKASRLLAEFREGYLSVAKVPGRFGGYIRVPMSVNAEWYQRFCRKYMSTRKRYPKTRTIIRRFATERGLQNVIAGKTTGIYVERLIAFIEDWC
jgi:hypothetical protein